MAAFRLVNGIYRKEANAVDAQRVEGNRRSDHDVVGFSVESGWTGVAAPVNPGVERQDRRCGRQIRRSWKALFPVLSHGQCWEQYPDHIPGLDGGS